MSTGLQTAEEIASGPDVISNPEAKASQEKVLASFNFAFNKFRSEINSKPPNQVSESDRQALRAIEGAFQTSDIRDGANFETGKFTYTNKIANPDDGPPILQEEGVPVEGLIKYLREKLVTIREDSPEKTQIEEALAILDEKSSQNYDAAHPGQKVDIDSQTGEADNPVMFARKKQEAKLISQSSQATGSMEGDWNKALDRLRQRQELSVPRGIPADQTLRDVEEPEEEEEELLPIATSSTTPTASTLDTPSSAITPPAAPIASPASESKSGPEKKPNLRRPGRRKPKDNLKPDSVTPNPDSSTTTTPTSREPEHYTIDIISAQDALDTRAHLQATENITAQIRRGRFYEFWHWPRKVGLRLIEGGAVNIQTDRLREACLRNNTSFCESNTILAATAAVNGAQERQQLVERFKEGKVLTRGMEQRVEAQGAMKQVVINELLNPIINGTVTNQDQVREALARFVRGHLNDPDNSIRTQIRELFGPQAQDFGTVAEYFATDLLEMGLRIKESTREHRLGLAELDQYIHINLGVAREASNTDTRSITDQWVARARERQNENLARGARYGIGFNGIIANPAVIGVVTALGANTLMRGAGWGARAAAITGPAAGALSGAVIAGVRRWVELGKDRRTDLAQSEVNELGLSRAQVEANLRTMGGWRGRLLRAPGVARAAGLYRRADLQEFHYDWAGTDQLRNGGGQEIVERGGIRRNAEDLARLDLTVQANRDEIGRRIAEIDVRLNRGQKENMAWIRYADKENINRQVKDLLDTRDRLRAVLGSNMRETDIDTLEAGWTNRWNKALEEDRRKKDRGFRGYRLRNTLGSSVFGAAMGLTFGLLSQETFAVARRAAGDTNVGNTILENMANRRPIDEWTSGGRAPGFAIDQSQELYDSPGNREVAKDLMAATIRREDGTVGLGFIDGGANTLSGPPGHVLENGSWVLSGNPENLPGQIRQVVEGEGWQSRPYNNPDFNISQKLQNLIQSSNREIFVHGNTIVSVDGAAGTVSMQDVPSGTNIYGHINTTDGSFVFDPQDPANKGVDWDVMRSRTGTEGWGVGAETIPGKPVPVPLPGPEAAPTVPTPDLSGKTVVDQLFDQPSEVLKAKGIIETDQFKKTWNFHVLRPDIVESTGQHTHRELALQLGGTFQVASGEFRTGAGAPGSLGFSDEIGKGLTPSHIPGVPAAEDKALSTLIDRSGGLIKKSDMVYIIDLTNGKQITIPLVDNLGNSNLPPELFDPKTGGLHGVDTIAAAVLEKSDGTVLRADELLESGQIPQGTTVHSFASEKFLPVEPPAALPPKLPPVTPPTPPLPPEPEPPHTGVKLVPPPATEFVPPPAKELEQDLLIPIPFAPRHPLDRTRLLLPPSSPEYPFGMERRDGGRGPAESVSQVITLRSPQHEWEKRLARLLPDRKPVRISRENQAAVKSKEIMAAVRESYLRAPHIYVAVSGAIGDATLTTAYINGLNEYARKLGQNKKLTVLAPSNIIPLLEPSARKHGYELVPINRHQGVTSAQELIVKNNETGALVMEFDIVPNQDHPEVELLDRESMAIRLLLSSSIGLYPTHRSGRDRFSAYFSDLLSIPKKDKVDIHPEIVVPENHEELFQEMVNKYHVETNKDQITIIVEGSFPAKRYSLENWKKVLTGLAQSYPNSEFNILFNSNNSSYSPDQLENLSRAVPGTRLVSEDLPHTAVFLKNQRLVISNDTGLAHIAATVENGPPVISLHLPTWPPSIWSSDPKRHMGLLPKRSLLREDQNSHEQDESKKWINNISPDEVIENGIRVLSGPALTSKELKETEIWTKRHALGQGRTTPQQLKQWTRRTQEEEHKIQTAYSGTLPALDALPGWEAQRNTSSLLSGQLASISNTLQGLGIFDSARHSEPALLAALGGPEYERAHKNGITVAELNSLLQKIAPEVTPKPSNSVSGILEAIRNGSAVLIQVQNRDGSDTRAALIPPGQRISRQGNDLMVQIIDSKQGVRNIPIEELIKSNITLANTPDASPAFILEKTSSTTARTPINPPPVPGDEQLAEKYWGSIPQDKRAETMQAILKLLEDLSKDPNRTLIVKRDPADPEYEKNQQALAVTRILAQQHNYQLGEVKPDPMDPGKGLVSVRKLPASQPAQPSTPVTPAVATPPSEVRSVIGISELNETEKWAKKHVLGQKQMSGEAKKQQIENWARREREERHRVEEMYPGGLPLQDTLPKWNAQRDNISFLSSQLASISNALQGLGIFDPARHSESALLTTLGGADYARAHRKGITVAELRSLLQRSAPEIAPKSSNSVSGILEAIRNGSAVLIQVQNRDGSDTRAALIPPGQRISRQGGNLMVQIIDSKQGVRDIPVEELIQSNITLANTPDASPAFILEKTSGPSTPTTPPASPASSVPSPAPAPTAPIPVPASPATAPATPGRIEITSSPANLVQSLNRELAVQTGPSATADLKPQFVADYLKSLEIPVATPVGQINAKVKKSHVSIIPAGPGGSPRLQIEGEIGAGFGPLGGGATFKVQLENDPSGGVRIVNFNPDDPAQLRLSGQAKGQKDGIVSNISHINELLADQINKSLDPNWRSNGFQIESDSLAFGFQKRAAP